MRCYWKADGGGSCHQNDANRIIIYGCENQHLGELAVCETHHAQWKKEFSGYWLYCTSCDSTILEWDSVYVRNLTVTYHLLRAS